MFLTVIIPTFNESENIQELLLHLQEISHRNIEIIVSDGGSTDGTQKLIEQHQNVILLNSQEKGRAKQMNAAAKVAKGDVLYFVHADTLPPKSFYEDIKYCLAEGFPIGCYRFKFNSDKRILKVNAYFTRFDRLMCRGGDQSLFITRKLFDELNGYCENHKVMEDYDIIRRARKKHPFKIIPKDVIVSARKYDYNSYLKVNYANFVAFMMFYAKVDHDKIIKFYRKTLNHKNSELKY
ncbi:TIGR04283 family arsenosugar biosynthesis glycosyltransferase [Pedobacter sp. SD-b]|uniref:TIGR04283 family arsenosugar biosynthesis glycosyltransferase n=1 Tax=Pedobacter segetis TaxID=2793069 RepID=A0ABS1BIS9_9SPHI|nr:TIGR04283 family arsenosugar biosynthesis glycosyltransferase [Pedobacter segetis]MBK0382656.1 TIGR04283 family arsenosugar biosynthesis glycosyltransferase [Pedobacter segetis]